MMPTSAQIQHTTATFNGANFHLASCGRGELVVLLHGFPECWYSWRNVMPELGQHYRVVAPDCRGYHDSDKSLDLQDYASDNLCADLLALLRHEGVDRCVLVGHDWGGLLAWQFAARHPDAVSRLVILNAPHPDRLQWALDHDPAQRAASQYIQRLRAPGCEERLGANGGEPLWSIVFGDLERRGLLDPLDKLEYMRGWDQPGAITAMLNWYRAAAVVVPDMEQAYPPGAVRRQEPRVRAPTMVVWGMQDNVLLPVLLKGLERHVESVTLRRIDDAGHGIVQEMPLLVAQLIHAFVSGKQA